MPLSKYLLWSVFIAGAGVMAAEMAAPRLLAPSFGASQLIWTNIIGTILTALTLGAFVGGRLADRWPTERSYALVLIIAGFSLALVPFTSRPFLAWAAAAMLEMKAGLFLISLFAVCICFAPPVFFMGMIAPWAVRIAGASRTDLGGIAGALAALSALGSIAGTFLTSLVILPLFGTRVTLLSTAFLIAATGAWRLLTSGGSPSMPKEAGEGKSTIFSAFLFFTLAVFVITPLIFKDAFGPIKSTKGQIFETESSYQYIEVIKSSTGRKFLSLNEGVSCHSILPAKGFLTGGYWDYISIIPAMNTTPGKPLRVLILGLAGGTMAREIDHFYGTSRKLSIDGVEIDPSLIETGKSFFELEKIPSLTFHSADARFFLQSTRKTYDLIVADAFVQPYIPFHMITKEFYRACFEHLSKNGIFVINVGIKKGDAELSDAFAATLNSSFPFVHSILDENENAPFDNHIFTGSGIDISPDKIQLLETGLERVLVRMKASWREIPPRWNTFIFTDDRSPIELITGRGILESVLNPRD